MSLSRENITFIRLNKNEEALLMDLEPRHHYDEDDSVNAYISLLQQTLQADFPNAKIEVVVDSQTTHSEIETDGASPYDLEWKNGLFDDLDNQETIKQAIEELAERVHQESLWRQVSRHEWLNIAEFSKRSKIPAFSLRWACDEEIIKSEDAKKVAGIWELAWKTISSIKKDFSWLICGKVLEITVLNDGNAFKTHEETIPDACPAIEQIMLIAPSVLGIPMFSNENSLLKVSNLSGDVYIHLEHFQDSLSWVEHDWSYSKYVDALAIQTSSRLNGMGEPVKTGGICNGVKLQFIFHEPLPKTLPELLASVASTIEECIQDAHATLAGGLTWKPAYEKSGGEDAFCREILGPLLRKLGYDPDPVRYTHGKRELGKDFVFSQRTPFGWLQYYGVQAKAGDIKSGVQSDINEIVNQIELAFQMPYTEPGSGNEVYISCFIVAISGKFKDNADAQILKRLERFVPRGTVFFLDKDRILSLIPKLWSK